MNQLETYGWNDYFARQLAPGESLQQVGRVVQEHKEAYLVRAAGAHQGNVWAEISGKMRHEGAVRADYPSVGDWVVMRGLELAGTTVRTRDAGPVHITRILPRRTTIARTMDDTDQQILAVNVDIAFLGTSLNENFNLRRLERYITLAHDARVRPIVLLTKADLCENPEPLIEQVRAVAGKSAVAIHSISVVSGQGMDDVRAYLQPGITAVILGSSGIGKSTLVNHLAEADLMDMMETREFDDKGRHCTTFRHLVRTPTGGLIIDTPGLRGLILGEAADALATTFKDIEQLAATCKFSNCLHDTEPGCAIKSAIEANTLDPQRLEGYLRLQRQMLAVSRKENRIVDRKHKKITKKLTAQMEEKQRRKWDR